jgi:hypothetical protein
MFCKCPVINKVTLDKWWKLDKKSRLPLLSRIGLLWRFGHGGSRFFLGRNEGQLLDDGEAGLAEHLVDGRAGEAGGVVLDADGLPLLVDLDAADPVNLAEIAQGGHGGFGGMAFVTVEGF